MGFNVTCSPGRDAAAGFMRITSQLPALVIYLDPVNLVIQLPTHPGGDLALAKFCRELSRKRPSSLLRSTRTANQPPHPKLIKPPHVGGEQL